MAVSGDAEGNAGNGNNNHRPKYWSSRGQWIECDWNEQLQRYVCKDVDANQVPTSLGGTGPG
jgi:hypothetical protein